MYKTSQGERTLRHAERRLFVESLGMIVDFLSDDNDYFAGITIFDDLQPGQKIAVLLGISRALLRDNVPPPPLTAVNEAAVAAVYRNIYDQVVTEIEIELSSRDGGTETPDVFGGGDEKSNSSWRELVLDACREATDLGNLSAAENSDEREWAFLIDCLRDLILWDTDWEMSEPLDADPEKSQPLKEELGIDDDYFVWVPPDPTNGQTVRMLTELRFLTPEGRGLEGEPPA